MTDLKTLNLTEKDFELMVAGLDELPNKGAVGEMMEALLIGMLGKDDPEAKEKMKREEEARRIQQKREKELMTEEIRILQGKLLMLKRYLMENKLLNDVYSIVNHVS